jgi:hypothetical protein
MKKFLKFITLILLISSLILPFKSQAIGQISKPIIIKDALRGQSYQEEMVIFNTEKIDLKLGLSAEGDIKDWVKFYNLSDQKNSISEVSMKAGSNLKVKVVFNISESAPNGEYKGLISAFSKPDSAASSTDSQVVLSQKIDRPVTITVSDNQIIKFDVSVIPSNYDLAKDEELSVRIIYDNQGNIDINPQIQVKIKKDEQIVYNVIYPYPENTNAITPNSRQEIEAIILQTIGYAKGQYLAEFDFLINNESKLHKQFVFSSGIYNDEVKVLGIFTSFNSNKLLNLPILIGLTLLAAAAALLSSRKYLKVKAKK